MYHQCDKIVSLLQNFQMTEKDTETENECQEFSPIMKVNESYFLSLTKCVSLLLKQGRLAADY